ncbi:MAG: DUF389 domain-containing protein, partial [Planctomycetales bacterium]
VRVKLGDDPIATTAAEADQQDLLLVGADNESHLPELLEKTKNPIIGVVHRAPQFQFWKGRVPSRTLLPRLNPTDYADLYEMLQTGSRWNPDFLLMLMLAAAIATLGLIQSSPTVVIGSMLLSPLMTPMIGMGLALNQGNAKLARTCLRSIGLGFAASLVVSYLIGLVTPGNIPTQEILARTDPNILDLLIALFSGMAAAYAMARPGLVGTIAGVAIATAIVPPLCCAGILLSYDHSVDAFGAASLLAANVIAIMLAATLTFRLMGLIGHTKSAERQLWVRRVVVALAVGGIAITLHLALAFFNQIHRGNAQPFAFPVTNALKNAIKDHVELKPGRSLLMIQRPGLIDDDDPIDVAIIVASKNPIPLSFADELTEIVREKMANNKARVSVVCVAEAWADLPPSARQ